jgi:hypothetical protein
MSLATERRVSAMLELKTEFEANRAQRGGGSLMSRSSTARPLGESR